MSNNFYENILRDEETGLKGLGLLLMKVKEWAFYFFHSLSIYIKDCYFSSVLFFITSLNSLKGILPVFAASHHLRVRLLIY
jgi:hypothetical protein